MMIRFTTEGIKSRFQEVARSNAIMVMRAFQMGLSLLAVQMTYKVGSEQLFLLFNYIVFFVGLHTCLTYNIQVEIWVSKNALSMKNIIQSIMAACVVGVVASLSFARTEPMNHVLLFMCAFTYIGYKFTDKIIFNYLISHNSTLLAYVATITIVIVEISSYLISYRLGIPDPYSRLILPPIICSIFIVIVPLSQYRHTHLSVSNSLDKVFLILHAFGILFSIMSDRLLIANIPSLVSDPVQYLLLYSYGGAIYTLLNSLPEANRSLHLQIAKTSNNSISFFNHEAKQYINIFLIINTIAAIAATIVLPFLLKTDFTKSELLSWYSIQAFFMAASVLSFFQLYFIGKRESSKLVVIWLATFAAKIFFLLCTGSIYFSNITCMIIAIFMCIAVGSDEKKTRVLREPSI